MTKTEIKTDDGRWKMKMNMMLKIKMEMMACHGRETERRKVSERQRFMRRRRACAVGRSCLAFVASEPIDDRGREASDCGSRAVRVGARNKASSDFRVERVSTHELIALESSPESCRSSSGLRLARGRSGRCRSSPQGRSPCGSS